MVVAYVALGSNLQGPETQVSRALVELDGLPQSRCLGHSSLYRSAPLVTDTDEPQVQPDYINAVAALETGLTPNSLLQALQELENRHGRVRGRRWGPRTLDLDLLLYGQMTIESEALTIPHPGLYERNFVLYPLAEVAAALGEQVDVPGRGPLQELLRHCPRNGLELVSG